MNRNSQNFKLGFFVVAGTALLVVVLIAVAGGEWRQSKIPVYTVFAESVQGLEVGSGVKFRGVPVGRVKSITVQRERPGVRVDMELYGGTIEFVDRKEALDFLALKVAEGARCRLEYAGITGMKYIEIDFYAPPGAEAPPPQGEPDDSWFLPSTPSLLSGLTNDVSYAVMKISQVDFEKIGTNLEELLVTVNNYLRDENLKVLIENLTGTSRELHELTAGLREQLSEQHVGATIGQLTQTLASVQSLAERIEAQLGEAQLPELSRSARQTLESFAATPGDLRKAIQAFSETLAHMKALTDDARTELGQLQLADTAQEARTALRTLQRLETEATTALNDLSRALDSVAAVARVLDEDPSALLRGKQKPGVKMGRD